MPRVKLSRTADVLVGVANGEMHQADEDVGSTRHTKKFMTRCTTL